MAPPHNDRPRDDARPDSIDAALDQLLGDVNRIATSCESIAVFATHAASLAHPGARPRLTRIEADVADHIRRRVENQLASGNATATLQCSDVQIVIRALSRLAEHA